MVGVLTGACAAFMVGGVVAELALRSRRAVSYLEAAHFLRSTDSCCLLLHPDEMNRCLSGDIEE